MVSFYKSKIATYLKCLLLISFSLLFCTTIFSQSIFTSTLNSTGDTKKLPATSPRFPNYFFEWSVGEATIITTNTAGNFQVTHGLLQGYLLIDSMGNSLESYLPKMQTDVTLESENRKIIIETKYYTSTLAERFETKKFHSHNLYQLYSYLRNLETKSSHKKNIESEGIIVYPVAGHRLNESNIMGTHKLSVKTLDLSLSWREIESQLFSFIDLENK